MAVGDQADDEAVNEVLLAHDDTTHLLPQGLDPSPGLLNGIVNGLYVRVGTGREGGGINRG